MKRWGIVIMVAAFIASCFEAVDTVPLIEQLKLWAVSFPLFGIGYLIFRLGGGKSQFRSLFRQPAN